MNFYDNFKSRLKSKKIAVGVIGMGYVGLPLAKSFVQKGNQREEKNERNKKKKKAL